MSILEYFISLTILFFFIHHHHINHHNFHCYGSTSIIICCLSTYLSVWHCLFQVNEVS